MSTPPSIVPPGNTPSLSRSAGQPGVQSLSGEAELRGAGVAR